jgi:hypothetical protein
MKTQRQEDEIKSQAHGEIVLQLAQVVILSGKETEH